MIMGIKKSIFQSYYCTHDLLCCMNHTPSLIKKGGKMMGGKRNTLVKIEHARIQICYYRCSDHKTNWQPSHCCAASKVMFAGLYIINSFVVDT